MAHLILSVVGDDRPASVGIEIIRTELESLAGRLMVDIEVED